jgi:hypothetical protein
VDIQNILTSKILLLGMITFVAVAIIVELVVTFGPLGSISSPQQTATTSTTGNIAQNRNDSVNGLEGSSSVDDRANSSSSFPPSTLPGNYSGGPNLSPNSRAFAIFMLPFEESEEDHNDRQELYTGSHYQQAMGVIQKHMNLGLNNDNKKDYNSAHNYIMQSIRAIAKSEIENSSSLSVTPNLESKTSAFFKNDEQQQPFDILNDFQKMIIIQSAGNVTRALAYSKYQYSNVTFIVYDIEHWSKTPTIEQQNSVESISYIGQRIHANSLKYGVTPDASFLLENYDEIDWKQIDFLGMQLQRFSQNISQFSTYVHQVSKYVKDANPSTQVFVQLSFKFTEVEEMIEAIDLVRPWVDGYIISYLPSSSNCLPECNPDALDQVLGAIQQR